MLPVLLIFLPTAILASNYGNYGSFQNPMVYHGDHNTVKPGSNLIFNFEQLRRDQPPQIEMRDESLGLYMHRRPQTTSTAAPIVVPEFKQNPSLKPFDNTDPFSRFSNIPAHVNNDYHHQSTPSYHLYHTNAVQSTPVYQPYYTMGPSTPMPSPPPAPQWSDFSGTFNKQVFPHYETQEPIVPKQSTPSEFNHLQIPQHQSAGPVKNRYEQKIPSAPEFTHFQRHQPNVARENSVNHDYRRNPAPPAHPYSSSTTQRNEYQNSASRGSHKFNWNDLATEPSWAQTSHQVSSTLAPVAQGKNPPPLPTLTPWLDGFGK